MKKILIGLLALGSISSFAALPDGEVTITKGSEIAHILNAKHQELEDPDCLKRVVTNEKSQIYIATGYKVVSLGLSRNYYELSHKNYLEISAKLSNGDTYSIVDSTRIGVCYFK